MNEATSVRLGGENLDSISINKTNLFPEGVESVPNTENFLITSLTEGTIYQVNQQGKLTPFAEDERLVSTIGIEIDRKQNRVLVANSDPGAGENSNPETQDQLAGLGIFDLTTGETIDYVNLGTLRPGEPHFANDIAVDDFGNTYVTDSFSPIIYKVDTEGNPSVFLEDEQFAGEGFNLNGIVAHPDDFLLVADSNDGLIYKVPLDNPEQFTQVDIDQKLFNADGLLLADEDELVVVTNDGSEESSNSVFALESDNNWESAQITDRLDIDGEFTTTATIKDEQIFVIDAALDKLFSNQLPFNDFEIIEVGSIVARDNFGFEDFLNNSKFVELFEQGKEIFTELRSNLEDLQLFTESFGSNFNTSHGSENYEHFFADFNDNFLNDASSIVKESDNINI